MNEEELCNIARAYVVEEYARVGERTYFWEEWGDPTDDATAHGVSGYAPPERGSYQWTEIESCEVTGCEIVERTDDGVVIEISAAIATRYGDSDDDEYDEPTPEERTISCWLEQADSGEWYVANAEE